MSYKNPSVSLPASPPQKSTHHNELLGKEYQTMNPAYFIFLDVLGFKETYSKNKNFKVVFEYFNSLIDQMRCLQEDPSNCYAGQTSDSLYFYTNRLNYLIDFVNVFLHFNMYAMSKNVFFRGGIAKGILQYNKPHQFFGDCVINSYLLEENISKFPRITIDRKTRVDLKKADITNWKFDEDDRRCYLNPFSQTAVEDVSNYLTIPSPKLQEINVDLLKRIRKNINENISEYEFSDSLYGKYWYLLAGCNELINSLENIKQ